MNAGLTPADVLVLDDGRVAIVDHGVCCAVDRARLATTRKAVQALRNANADGFADALAALGLLEREPATRALALLRDLAGPGKARLDAAAVRDAGLRIILRRDPLIDLLRTSAPATVDIWPTRGVAQLFATIARIGATHDWSDLAVRALDGD